HGPSRRFRAPLRRRRDVLHDGAAPQLRHQLSPVTAARPTLHEGLVAGGAPRMWARIVRGSLPAARAAAPGGSRVLEIGYGDGALSCWLASELGWSIVGLDVRADAREAAQARAAACGLGDRLDFRLCAPEDTRRHAGAYDAVFIKTVLYSSSS